MPPIKPGQNPERIGEATNPPATRGTSRRDRGPAALTDDRLHFAATHPLIQTLRQELLDMRVKVSPASGRDTYEALTESAHDDLATALCLAVL